MEINVKIQNLSEVRALLAKFPQKMSTYLNQAIKRSIFQIERKTKPITPVDTGRLRASIGGGSFRGGSYASGTGIAFKSLYGEIGSTVDYAIFVHEGTRFMRGRPFMEEGLQAADRAIQEEFEGAVTRVIRETSND